MGTYQNWPIVLFGIVVMILGYCRLIHNSRPEVGLGLVGFGAIVVLFGLFAP